MRPFLTRPVINGIRVFIVVVMTFGSQVFGVSPVSANTTLTIVDTLGAATPSTQFQLAGSGGQGISNGQLLGPEFTLAQNTEITEIGAFVTYCELLGGVLNCPKTKSMAVQILPATNGLPDLSRILATFDLPKDRTPQDNSYQAARLHLRLKPGTYFAIFIPRDGGTAGLMGSASDPFQYQAGLATIGFVFPLENRATVGQVPLAVRILGKIVKQKCEDKDRTRKYRSCH